MRRKIRVKSYRRKDGTKVKPHSRNINDQKLWMYHKRDEFESRDDILRLINADLERDEQYINSRQKYILYEGAQHGHGMVENYYFNTDKGMEAGVLDLYLYQNEYVPIAKGNYENVRDNQSYYFRNYDMKNKIDRKEYIQLIKDEEKSDWSSKTRKEHFKTLRKAVIKKWGKV